MRLLNLAKEEKQEYMKVLVRYLHERLLFRISSSPYKRHFLLKGSSLLFALDRFKARPTIDIDLLGERISNDKDNLKVVFEKICSIECEDDNYRKGMVSALEVFDSLKDNLKHIEKDKERMTSFAENIVNTNTNQEHIPKQNEINEPAQNNFNTEHYLKAKPMKENTNINFIVPKSKTSNNSANEKPKINTKNSKPKEITIKSNNIFSQRAMMKKVKNEYFTNNAPKGNQKIVFPSTAIKTNKINTNHTPYKKDDISPFSTKSKKLNFESNNTKETFKLFKIKDTSIGIKKK